MSEHSHFPPNRPGHDHGHPESPGQSHEGPPVRPTHVVFDTPLKVDVHHHYADHSRDAQRIEDIYHVTLQMLAMSRRMRQAIAGEPIDQPQLLITEGEIMSSVPQNLDEAITQLKNTSSDENSAAAALVQAFSDQAVALAAALAAAGTAGATPAQLQELQVISDGMTNTAQVMRNALASPPPAGDRSRNRR